MPLVLAIPTFKCEQFLGATLESLNAEGDRVRWWLQDGASPDRTVEIAREFARAGDTIVTEPDSGQTDALNRAMSRMGGDIIGFINGDDCLVRGAGTHVLDYFAAHPDVDLVCGSVEWIDADGKITGSHAGRIDTLKDALDIYRVWWGEQQWVQPEVFFRRSLWERVGGFDTAYHLAFDYDFWVRCFMAGARVAHLPEPFARFRLHSGQKSTASQAAADEIRTILEKHLTARPSAINPLLRYRLRAELAYDRFAKTSTPGGRARPTFTSALLSHPSWFLSTQVRDRLLCSLRKHLPWLPRFRLRSE